MERHYRDIQDVEFVIERGKLWILTCRTGKRTSRAALRIAVDMFEEGLLTERETILRVSPAYLHRCFVPRLADSSQDAPIAIGLNASGGVASGAVVFSAEAAEEFGTKGKKAILIRPEVHPDDVPGILAAEAVITSWGGMGSHAAVVCRGLGKPCVAGCEALDIEVEQRLFRVGDAVVKEGDVITVDGSSGCVFLGELPLEYPAAEDDPDLSRYASLVKHVDTDDFVENGVGILWTIKDIIREHMLAGVTRPTSAARYRKERGTTYLGVDEYVPFTPPFESTICRILHQMHWLGACEFPDDVREIVWGLRTTAHRLLRNAVGISNHHLTIRPLLDPSHSFVGIETKTLNDQGSSRWQLVGEEYFGINHWLKNYLDWADIQWWVVVDASEEVQYWALDRTNPQGECLITGAGDLKGFLVVVNGACLSVKALRRFYNQFRKRESGWDWYAQNKTSKQEILDALICIEQDKLPCNHEAVDKCRDLGLIDVKNNLTYLGRSLLHRQFAQDRKAVTFLGGRYGHRA